MNYREQRKIECRKLFQGFEPDLTKSRRPKDVTLCLEHAREGLFSHEIAEKTGLTPKAVQKIFRRYRFPCLQNFCPPLREDRIGWKGGVTNVNGYLYSRTPGHPYARKFGNYVAVHRLVAEQHLGRFLLPSEAVHHLDGNPLNNAIENLKVYASNGDHLAETLRGKRHNISEKGRAAIREAVIESNRRRGATRVSNQKTW
jgi:hypothetical protein